MKIEKALRLLSDYWLLWACVAINLGAAVCYGVVGDYSRALANGTLALLMTAIIVLLKLLDLQKQEAKIWHDLTNDCVDIIVEQKAVIHKLNDKLDEVEKGGEV